MLCAVCVSCHLFISLLLCSIFLQGESRSSHAHAQASQSQSQQMSSEERKQKWEQGQADYLGMDSFDNIQRKLDTFLK